MPRSGPINFANAVVDDPEVTSPVVGRSPRLDVRAHGPADPFAGLLRTVPATLTLIIPMYREAGRIGATIATLAASTLHRDEIEFVFVDDGSPDGTTRAAQSAIDAVGLRRAWILRLSGNAGKGGALKAAVQHATGRNIGFVDADLSLDPAVISGALARLVSTSADLVIGHRVVDAKHQPKLRRVASLVFGRIARRLVPTTATDTQCAMKLFRGPVAKDLFFELVTTGFAFDVELLRRADRAGLRIEDIPVAWQHQPGSQLNTVTDSLRMLRQILVIRRLVG
jgi:dolichyl-phosphate beta-glucosyltransferase